MFCWGTLLTFIWKSLDPTHLPKHACRSNTRPHGTSAYPRQDNVGGINPHHNMWRGAEGLHLASKSPRSKSGGASVGQAHLLMSSGKCCCHEEEKMLGWVSWFREHLNEHQDPAFSTRRLYCLPPHPWVNRLGIRLSIKPKISMSCKRLAWLHNTAGGGLPAVSSSSTCYAPHCRKTIKVYVHIRNTSPLHCYNVPETAWAKPDRGRCVRSFFIHHTLSASEMFEQEMEIILRGLEGQLVQ